MFTMAVLVGTAGTPLLTSLFSAGGIVVFPQISATLTFRRLVSIHHSATVHRHDCLYQVFHHLFPPQTTQHITQLGLYFLWPLLLLFHTIPCAVLLQPFSMHPHVLSLEYSRLRGHWGTLPRYLP